MAQRCEKKRLITVRGADVIPDGPSARAVQMQTRDVMAEWKSCKTRVSMWSIMFRRCSANR